MNIYDFYTDITEQFTFPDAPTGTPTVEVTYEWGDEIVASTNATSVSGNIYSVAIGDELVDSAGSYRIKWTATINGTSRYFYTSFSVQRPYTTEASFEANYPNFVSFTSDEFELAERNARRIIESHTGQDFQFIKNKTLTLEGTGRATLYLPERLESFSSVLVSDVDYLDAVEVDYKDKRFLKLSTAQDVIAGPISISKFQKGVTVEITGDWKWYDVPWQIKDAAEMLIADLLDDVRRENFKYNVQRVWQDTNRIEMNQQGYETTGNLDVDVLLMDFVYWVLDYVS
jgi:hypothetical protein